jgi:hypothetical protein
VIRRVKIDYWDLKSTTQQATKSDCNYLSQATKKFSSAKGVRDIRLHKYAPLQIKYPLHIAKPTLHISFVSKNISFLLKEG